MFSYVTSLKSNRTATITPDFFLTVLNSTIVRQNCQAIARALEDRKSGKISGKKFDEQKRFFKEKLPAFLFHATFPGGKRLNSLADPSGMCIFDLDHYENPRELWKSISPRKEELGILLAHVTPSCEGLRLVFLIPSNCYTNKRGEELARAQKWMAGQLGLKKYDISVKDYARLSFAVPSSYILYMDKEGLFADHSPKFNNDNNQSEDRNNATKPDSDSNSVGYSVRSYSPGVEDKEGGRQQQAEQEDLRIFDNVVKACNLTLSNLTTVGTRHTSLLIVLSSGITKMIPRDRLWACIAQRTPEFSNESDCVQLFDDWYKNYDSPNRPMSRQMKRIYTESLNKGNSVCQQDEPTQDFKLNVEAMPPALRSSLITIPENMRMPVLISLLPLAATYADNVTYKYLNGDLQRLALMSFVVGPQASGKGACTRIVNLWIKPLLEMDDKARKAEDDWNEKARTRSDSEELPEVPKAVIRNIPVTISNKQLLTRLANAGGHCLYSFCSEIDTLVQTNKAGAWSDKLAVYRYAFDGDYWAMDYSNIETIRQFVKVHYNLSLLGTFGGFRRFFGDENIENGLATRVLLAEMPDNSFMPLEPYLPITAKMEKDINDGITKLINANGVHNCPKLYKLFQMWSDEKLDEALDNNDRVMDTFRRRAAVIGMRCGVVLEILEGRESDRVLNLSRLLADYILHEQCKLFGNPLTKINNENSMATYKIKPRKIRKLLPEVFDYNMLRSLAPDYSYNALRQLIYRWVDRGLVKRMENGVFKKLN